MSHRHEPARGSASSGQTALEKSLETIVNVYHQNSVKQDKNDLLSLQELMELLKKEAPGFLSVCNRKRPGYIKELFHESDTDQDRQLTFEEFTAILSKLAIDAHHLSHGEDPCGPDRH